MHQSSDSFSLCSKDNKSGYGSGKSISEALQNYIRHALEGETVTSNGMGIMTNSDKPVSPLFAGISVKISDDESASFLDSINRVNKEWLPICSPLFGHEFTEHCETCESSTIHKNISIAEENCSSIRLQDSHHITLYFFGKVKKTPEEKEKDAQWIKEQLDKLDPNYRVMLDNLTPYEFAVALFYKKFYKIPFLFEDAHTEKVEHVEPRHGFPMCCKNVQVKNDQEEPSLVPVKMHYLVLVPGVVLLAIVSLGKSIVSIPAKDFKTFSLLEKVPFVSEEHGLCGSRVGSLIKKCENGNSVMVEDHHCTHITLGTAKEYKPVISNNICEAIQSYLTYANAKCSHNKECSGVVKISKHDIPKKVSIEELSSNLKVYSSGPYTFGDIKLGFVASIPWLLSGSPKENELCEPEKPLNMQHHKGNHHFKIKDEYKDIYRDTTCFFSEDHSWFYIRKLPVVQEHESGDNNNAKWLVDAYIVPINKIITGNIQFNG
ncbi:hypothetical protein BEWA_006230 [Theileria equi strain WA]|uniref:Uncharacterized protein n=1 Tax=Theileria equi strain WA TaxID=1537102 RepID=L0B255_THEEQ|nr:hypothetical protein BEWA_006230 [Theileria equi strain WA]AFZ81214.1 hypothetical protein BEWA_006230 [Theileria equi strain WA]|eukprot:XP_004830880.1 hypothetical protein BEWA_006230 [Theileria equi strain WA]